MIRTDIRNDFQNVVRSNFDDVCVAIWFIALGEAIRSEGREGISAEVTEPTGEARRVDLAFVMRAVDILLGKVHVLDDVGYLYDSGTDGIHAAGEDGGSRS